MAPLESGGAIGQTPEHKGPMLAAPCHRPEHACLATFVDNAPAHAERTAWARDASYFAPNPTSSLWQRGSAWLGYGALTGAQLPQPTVPGISPQQMAQLTASARHYGFHATLRAPFEPADGVTPEALSAALARFARSHTAFDVPLVPATYGQFVALRPMGPCPALDALHAASLHAFEPLRAPISPADIARRRETRLAPPQDAAMLRWGYPFVLDHYRFHLTLTEPIKDPALRATMLAGARAHFAPEGALQRVDGVALFAQESREDRFRLLVWEPLG